MSEKIFLKGLEQFRVLSDFLTRNKSRQFVFEILPSSFPWPEDQRGFLLVDGDAVAIRKSDLVKSFLSAQACLLSKASKQNESDLPVVPCPQALDDFDARIAAWVVLLYDPEHLTAVNYLRRVLRDCDDPSHRELSTELNFCQSVLTSPLHKHSKSPTLWTYRLWLMRNYEPWKFKVGRDPFSLTESAVSDSTIYPTETYPEGSGVPLWLVELAIALRAAEQHARNYHAFQYLRLLCLVLDGNRISNQEPAGWSLTGAETIRKLTKWCLQHPRDVSGLTFFAWFIRRANGHSSLRTDVSQAVQSFQSFRSSLQWRGESIEVFLRATSELGIP